MEKNHKPTSILEIKKKMTPMTTMKIPTIIHILRVKGLRRDRNLGESGGTGLAKVKKSLS